MFVTKVNKVSLVFVQHTMSICVNTTLRLVHKGRKDRKLLVQVSYKDISKVHSKHSEIITMASCLIIFSFTEMESAIQ